MAGTLIVRQTAHKEFEKLPEGQFPCVCIAVIDIGTHDASWNNQPKKKHYIRFVFEFPTKTYTTPDGEEKPFQLTMTHTLSLSRKSNLRPFLGAWRGNSFTEEELIDGVDMEWFLGKEMLANIGHTIDGEKTYVNIISNMKLPEGMTCPKPTNELIFYSVSDHDEVAFQKLSQRTQEKIMEADEMQIGSGSSSGPKAPVNEKPQVRDSEKYIKKESISIEDVPF